MAKLLLLCFIAFASAQLDFEEDDPTGLLDNDLARDIAEAIFGDDKRTITIYTNFDNPNDQFFFQNVLPWLVDNIGNYLQINYRFIHSARRSGPTSCALRAMRTNTYAQAEYLRCESRGTPALTCVDQAPINRRRYNRCLNERVDDYVRDSQWDFARLTTDQTPIVVVGNNRREINTNDPQRLLRFICLSFGRSRPVGCLRTTSLPPELNRNVPTNVPAPTNILQVTDNVNNMDDVFPSFMAEPANVVEVTQGRNFTEIATGNSRIPSQQCKHSSTAIRNTSPVPLQICLGSITLIASCYLSDSLL